MMRHTARRCALLSALLAAGPLLAAGCTPKTGSKTTAPASTKSSPPAGAKTTPGTRPIGLLVEPAELKTRLDEDNLRIVDVRPAADYKAGHIPGAVHVDVADWKRLSLSKDGLHNKDAWAERIGTLGITAKTNVVVYGGHPTSATRIWWTLKYVGVDRVGVLNGGWNMWKAFAGKSSSAIPNVTKTDFVPKFQTKRLAEIGDLKSSYKSDDVVLVDARSAVEFNGTGGPGTRKGHIPGAKRIEWSDLLDPGGVFKSKKRLQADLFAQGLRRGKTIVTYCQTGGRASLDAFALELAGFPKVKNYYCSWQQWSADPSVPVETTKP